MATLPSKINKISTTRFVYIRLFSENSKAKPLPLAFLNTIKANALYALISIYEIASMYIFTTLLNVSIAAKYNNI